MIRTRSASRLAFSPAILLASLCLWGACTNTDTITQKLAIGSPCTDASSCGSAPPFYCDGSLPGGYCKKDCKTDADCPSEATCVLPGGDVGSCHFKCDGASMCRSGFGYVCRPPSPAKAPIAAHAYCDEGDGSADMATRPMDGSTD